MTEYATVMNNEDPVNLYEELHFFSITLFHRANVTNDIITLVHFVLTVINP